MKKLSFYLIALFFLTFQLSCGIVGGGKDNSDDETTQEETVTPKITEVKGTGSTEKNFTDSIVIIGENFEASSSVYLKKGSDKIDLKSEFLSSEQLTAKLNEKIEAKVTYKLFVQNTDGEEGSTEVQFLTGEAGKDGAPGASILWLGTFETAPESPVMNSAYYNSKAGISYIWNGTEWSVLAMDGKDGANGTRGAAGTAGDDAEFAGIFHIDSEPVKWAIVGEDYAYEPTATDPNIPNDPTQYVFELVAAPQGMSMAFDPDAGNFKIRWIPQADQVDQMFNVSVNAYDPDDFTKFFTQNFGVNVYPEGFDPDSLQSFDIVSELPAEIFVENGFWFEFKHFDPTEDPFGWVAYDFTVYDPNGDMVYDCSYEDFDCYTPGSLFGSYNWGGFYTNWMENVMEGKYIVTVKGNWFAGDNTTGQPNDFVIKEFEVKVFQKPLPTEFAFSGNTFFKFDMGQPVNFELKTYDPTNQNNPYKATCEMADAGNTPQDLTITSNCFVQWTVGSDTTTYDYWFQAKATNEKGVATYGYFYINLFKRTNQLMLEDNFNTFLEGTTLYGWGYFPTVNKPDKCLDYYHVVYEADSGTDIVPGLAVDAEYDWFNWFNFEEGAVFPEFYDGELDALDPSNWYGYTINYWDFPIKVTVTSYNDDYTTLSTDTDCKAFVTKTLRIFDNAQ